MVRMLAAAGGQVCGGLSTVACGVGGRAWGVREEGWRRRRRQKKAVGCIRASVFCSAGCSPTVSAGSAG